MNYTRILAQVYRLLHERFSAAWLTCFPISFFLKNSRASNMYGMSYRGRLLLRESFSLFCFESSCLESNIHKPLPHYFLTHAIQATSKMHLLRWSALPTRAKLVRACEFKFSNSIPTKMPPNSKFYSSSARFNRKFFKV